MTRPQEDLTVFIMIADGGTNYVDVTADVKSMSWTRGRERPTDDFQPGRGRIVLRDTARTYDPSNTAGTYYTGLTPHRPVRILWNSNPIFHGYVTGWSVEYPRGDSISYVTVDFVDALGIFARIELDEISPAAFSGDAPGTRVGRVLTLADASLFLTGQTVDTGLSTLGATTYGENALSYLQTCARAEAGYLFVDQAGLFKFLDRHTTLNVESTYEFTDQLDVADTIPYTKLSQSSNTELLYNKVTGRSATTSNDQSVGAATEQQLYFLSVLPLGDLFNSTDAEVLNLLYWHLNRFRQPEARFTGIEIQLMGLSTSGSPSPLETAMLMDLLTVVTVNRRPLATGASVERKCIVERVEHEIVNDSWIVRLGLANADTRPFLVLDHATFGVLGQNRLAF